MEKGDKIVYSKDLKSLNYVVIKGRVIRKKVVGVVDEIYDTWASIYYEQNRGTNEVVYHSADLKYLIKK